MESCTRSSVLPPSRGAFASPASTDGAQPPKTTIAGTVSTGHLDMAALRIVILGQSFLPRQHTTCAGSYTALGGNSSARARPAPRRGEKRPLVHRFIRIDAR